MTQLPRLFHSSSLLEAHGGGLRTSSGGEDLVGGAGRPGEGKHFGVWDSDKISVLFLNAIHFLRYDMNHKSLDSNVDNLDCFCNFKSRILDCWNIHQMLFLA